MRTRLLSSIAVAAAALLAPSAALAVTAPVVTAPGITNQLPVLSWTDAGDETGIQVLRGSGACASSPTLDPTGLTVLPGAANDPRAVTDVTLSSDGTYCYEVDTTDGVGTAASNQVTVKYDTTPPSASITTPALVHTTSNVLTVSTPADTASVTFQRSTDDLNWNTISTDNSAPFTASWDVGDGQFFVRAIATDTATNTDPSPASSALQVDTTPPAVSLTSPSASTVVQGASVTVSANATDGGAGVTGVTFWVQPPTGSPVSIGTDTSNPYSLPWNTTGYADGVYSVWAVAVDGATLSTDSAHVGGIRVDNVAPTVSVTAPLTASTVHGNAVTVSGSAADPGSGTITGVEFFVQPATGPAVSLGLDTSSPYSVVWNTLSGSYPDGTYGIYAIATDGASHSTSSTTIGSVRVDNTAPTVAMTSPVAAVVVHGAVNTVTANASDAGIGVTSVSFFALPATGPAIPIGAPDTTSPYSVTWNTTSGSFPDGTYSVYATATDGANPATTSALIAGVVVDNTVPPTPATPTGLTPASVPTINFTPVTDVTSGAAYYDVYRDGVKINSLPIPHVIGTASYSWSDVAGSSTAPVTVAGAHLYRVVAVDKAANSSLQSNGVSIFFDSTGDSVPTNVTAAASPTSQHPQLSWGAPPNFPTFAHYKLYRGGVFLTNLTATSYADNAATDGTFTYQVIAADAGDNPGVASAPVTVIYDTLAPSGPGGVAATAQLDGSVGVSWAASGDGAGSGVARYVVRRSLSSTPPATIADGDATCSTSATSCNDASTLNGKLYSYSVFAVDRAGNTSVAGTSQAVTARDQTAPAVPTGLAAVPGDGSVALSWAPAAADDDVAGYVLVAKPGATAPTSESDGLRVCSAIVAASSQCTAGGLTNGASYTFGLFALDEALNRSQPAVVRAGPNGKVDDSKAPAAVAKLAAKVHGRTVTLTWKNPADKDFDHVVISVSTRKPTSKTVTKRLYTGRGTKTTAKLAAGQSRWFVVVAYDVVGNASPPATVRATIPAASPFTPAPRARVKGNVKLAWPAVKGAHYYNVQIFSGKKRVIVGWPAGHGLILKKLKLKKGRKYTWYVWPGLGAKSKAHYGKLIGKNVFTFTG